MIEVKEIVNPWLNCKICKGSGLVITENYKKKTCPYCKGTGHIESKRR